jgi:hypothetical protein
MHKTVIIYPKIAISYRTPLPTDQSPAFALTHDERARKTIFPICAPCHVISLPFQTISCFQLTPLRSSPLSLPSVPSPPVCFRSQARASRAENEEGEMSVGSWCSPAIPGTAPLARGGLPGGAVLVAARPQPAGRCRATSGRHRLGSRVVARAGAAETPVAGAHEDAAAVLSEKFPLRRCQTVTCSASVCLFDPCSNGVLLCR